jgi:hypothetical protein
MEHKNFPPAKPAGSILATGGDGGRARNHFARVLVSAGQDLLMVQKLLTHKDSRTTQRSKLKMELRIKDWLGF